MKLLLKFNLVFLIVFALGLGAAGYIARALLQQNAHDEVLDRVRHMFLSTAFIAGRLRGEDVASYKDLELVLTSPG